MRLFTSATVKLTAWFLCILMTTSILFSAIVFQVTRGEISTRLKGLETGLTAQTSLQASETLRLIHARQLDEATGNLLLSLLYINLVVLIGGGGVSYVLARRVLAPIKAIHRAQSRFVSNASHQLRTPLAVMQAETELALSDDRLTKAQARAQLEDNLEQVQRLSQLSTVLLRLSQSEQTLESSQRTDPVNITQEIERLAHNVDATTRLTFTRDIPLITTSTAIVREILAILLDNAVKYSPPGSPIVITYTSTRQAHQLAITNQGKPIKAAQAEKIFEQFYRASATSQGYGLGLPLARQLAKLLDGTLVYAPTSDARNRFVLSLPK